MVVRSISMLHFLSSVTILWLCKNIFVFGTYASAKG